ncbi:expressed unknown protein [Seminavis robusta]|uniref:Uncharacterized protein n=1 Tax=Seminavis robusta TaxID=568900 RepID=A0A9N8DLI9_9STRA|nr:expressed unknown protein [Seminavis robusta]|eukprot:Sro145_g067330.1 n/a (226) ;mRNA; f:62147-62824
MRSSYSVLLLLLPLSLSALTVSAFQPSKFPLSLNRALEPLPPLASASASASATPTTRWTAATTTDTRSRGNHGVLYAGRSPKNAPVEKSGAAPSTDASNATGNTKVIYKDDCFGLMSFLAGIGTRDPVFTGIFCLLSLLADVGTRQRWLPADYKNPEIVSRKVPAVIAILTLVLTPVLVEPLTSVDASLFGAEPDPIARPVQLVIGGFSIVTGLLDIRWRDRFNA